MIVIGYWCLNSLYMTHIVIQCIFNSFACGTCALECVCMRVLGWSVGGAAQIVPPPSPGVKTLQTLGAHRGNSPKSFQQLRRVTGEKFRDRRQEAADSLGNGDRTEGSSSPPARVRREVIFNAFFFSLFPLFLPVSAEQSRKTSLEGRVTEVSCQLATMLCVPGFRWVFLNALLHTVAPWGAQRPDRPRQCDAPKSVSQLGHDLR